MPRYVTESGYEETEDQRTRVGRNLPTPQTLRLVDLADRSVRVLSYDGLPGIASEPLAAMRVAQKLDPIKGNRAVRIETEGDGQGPIEYAENLRGHLLIAHGIIDDNVFYQDSLRMAQRLIELRKDHWELAGYPLERHGFERSESWYDEYRRILQLFEHTLK